MPDDRRQLYREFRIKQDRSLNLSEFILAMRNLARDNGSRIPRSTAAALEDAPLLVEYAGNGEIAMMPLPEDGRWLVFRENSAALETTTQAEINDFMRAVSVGSRPTWKLETSVQDGRRHTTITRRVGGRLCGHGPGEAAITEFRDGEEIRHLFYRSADTMDAFSRSAAASHPRAHA